MPVINLLPKKSNITFFGFAGSGANTFNQATYYNEPLNKYFGFSSYGMPFNQGTFYDHIKKGS